VFIHGYNVSFEEAALRSAQIAYDLGISGPVAFFSWPSKGTLAGYLADAATIEASEEPIAAFISQFAKHSGATRVTVISHSMGNRGVLRAISRLLGGDANRAGAFAAANLILAAPDVDRDVFRNLAQPLVGQFERVTIYVSDRDKALKLSGYLSDYPRAGICPPITVLKNAETVYVGNIDLSFLGHGYIAAARDVLYDMHALIAQNLPAGQRMGLRKLFQNGEKFWSISA
jgi:esterase/lipase superfamily enzyme